MYARTVAETAAAPWPTLKHSSTIAGMWS